MVLSLQAKGREFEFSYVLGFYFLFHLCLIPLSSSILDVSRPLSNVLCIIIFQKGDFFEIE